LRKNLSNIDPQTVKSFEDEWSRFDQTEMSEKEAQRIFDLYFSIFPWAGLPSDAEGFDMGCGSGRWARLVAPRVHKLNCIEPSGAIEVARRLLVSHKNIVFHKSSVESVGLLPASQDFGYALGVLHHVPNTASAIKSCVELLKVDAPLLVYLYYAFDNRPTWYRTLWRISDSIRGLIYRLPPRVKNLITDVIAAFIYWPLARLSGVFAKVGLPVHLIPLSFYREYSFYVMRTDARDRFGTPLETRFTRAQIESMMLEAGLRNILFSERAPYWCAIGLKI
jgi:SAM-dependent methyltransferase